MQKMEKKARANVGVASELLVQGGWEKRQRVCVCVWRVEENSYNLRHIRLEEAQKVELVHLILFVDTYLRGVIVVCEARLPSPCPLQVVLGTDLHSTHIYIYVYMFVYLFIYLYRQDTEDV